MDGMIQAQENARRHRQILFDRRSLLLQPLRRQIAEQSHIVIVAWCLDWVAKLVKELQAYLPQEQRGEQALALCRQWARGEVKMPQAKAAILAVHAIAKEQTNPMVCLLAHAIGQGLGSVHVETHAIGMVMYDLTAQAHLNGLADGREAIERRVREYEESLKAWSEQPLKTQPWAAFLLKERENKEALLLKREEENAAE